MFAVVRSRDTEFTHSFAFPWFSKAACRCAAAVLAAAPVHAPLRISVSSRRMRAPIIASAPAIGFSAGSAHPLLDAISSSCRSASLMTPHPAPPSALAIVRAVPLISRR